VVERRAFESEISGLPRQREHPLVGFLRFLPIARQLVRPAQVDVQVLDFSHRREASRVTPAAVSSHEVARPIVVADRVLRRGHRHGYVACLQQVAEGNLMHPRGHSVVRQERSGGAFFLQRRKCPAVEDAPPGGACLGVGHVAHLVVREGVDVVGLDRREEPDN
jgi:hypothetical protein